MSAFLQAQLKLPYNSALWFSATGLLRQILPAGLEIFAQPVVVNVATFSEEERRVATAFRQLGRLVIPAGSHGPERIVALHEITVTDHVDLLRNRVGLRRLVARDIDEVTNHAVLAFFIQPGETAYRLTYATRESVINAATLRVEQRETAARRYTYVLGPGEARRTAADRLAALGARRARATLDDLTAAFAVESLNDEFFELYKQHYTKFCAHLLNETDAPVRLFGILPGELVTAEDDEAALKRRDRALKPVRDFVKKLLGRLVFLHFIQKKGWLGCPAGRTDWIGGDPEFLKRLFREVTTPDRFHSERLVPLFYETLNRPDRPGHVFAVTGTRVPYLNGGLFERDFAVVDQIDFPGPLFAGLIEFFAGYNFTIDENDPEEHEVGIDPEMLGHIFENLLEDNKDKGAYYTPKAVVHYMARQSLVHALAARFPSDVDATTELTAFLATKDPVDPRADTWLTRHATALASHLDDLRICDPAIGSGAFPIGLLHEIYWAKLALNPSLSRADAKRSIIQQSIHGVDLDAGAVEIARLRFWLALVVDEASPSPLPNLDYQIMQGNSLLESFEGEPLHDLAEPRRYGVRRLGSDQNELDLGGGTTELIEVSTPPQQALADLRAAYFRCHDPAEKLRLRTEIDAAVLRAIDARLELRRDELEISLDSEGAMARGRARSVREVKKRIEMESELAALGGKQERLHALLADPRAERPFFLWRFWFRPILAEPPEGRGGFDIVIANPPYVRQEAISHLKPELERAYESFDGTADLYVYFLEAGVKLLREGGTLTYITSNSFLMTGFGEPLRKYLRENCAVERIVDFGGVTVFESAKDTYVCIPQLIKGGMQERVKIAKMRVFNVPDLAACIVENQMTISPERLTDEAWRLKSDAEAAVFGKIQRVGMPLGEYVRGEMFYGLKTGLNEAFELTQEQRDEFLRECPVSASLIKPFLGGQDIRRYFVEDNRRFLIVIPCGWTREQMAATSDGGNEPSERDAITWLTSNHPSIARHLGQFRAKLKKREDQGHYWWELRPCDYYSHLDAPKIVFPDICKAPRFALDSSGIYLANTAYCLGTESLYLLGILNSRLFWFVISNLSIPFGVRAGQYRYRLIYQYMEKVPIATGTLTQQAELTRLVDQILTARSAGDAARVEALEVEIDTRIYDLYGLTPADIALIEGNP